MAKRDFSKYLVNNSDVGPEATFGDQTVQFKGKQPLSAIIALLTESGDQNQLERSKNYLRLAAIQTSENLAALENLFDNIELTGLSDLVEWLTGEYTTFPTEKPAGS